MRRHIGTLLIVIGIIVIAFPLVGRYVANKKQEEMLDAFYLDTQMLSANATDEYSELDSVFGLSETEEGNLSSENTLDEVGEIVLDGGNATSIDFEGETGAVELSEDLKTLGVMNIEKIDLRAPIAEGTELSVLKYSIGHMESTTSLGSIGNSVVAGHRSHSYGVYFNRLDELENGDEIVVETYSGTYTYVVYEILIVEPDDVSVLRNSSEYRVLTLVTCDPVYNPTHRLIIHAIDKNQL